MDKLLKSVLNIKSVDEDKRIIEGIASTPVPDRYGDVVVPEGIQFKLPIPFLYQHVSSKVIGNVLEARIGAEGMAIKAQLAPRDLEDEDTETAWKKIKGGLVRGLSIGFRSLEESYDKVTGGFRYLKTEILEISAVTIPANAEASITSVKSADSALAAFGCKGVVLLAPGNKNIPGASGSMNGQKAMKTIAEQIAACEAKRAASTARMTEIMTKAGDEGRTLNEAESQEYDGLQSEVKSIDEHLVRLRVHEKQVVATATPITDKTAGDPDSASRARGGIVTVKGPDLPRGTAFTRYAIALMRAKGNLMQAAEIAKGWKDSTPQVEMVLKAAVSAGTTTATGWAAELADYTYMASEFIELLRPKTIIGRIPGLRRVPFNIKVPRQTAGMSAGWVGEGSRKPVGSLSFDTVEFRFAKAAGIVVLTEELVRFSNPSAEALVRADMVAGIAKFLDEQFIDPTVTVSLNVSPASITNGAGTKGAAGTSAANFRSDLKAALTVLLDAEIDPVGSVFVMRPIQAVAMSQMVNALGNKEFPEITASGGRLEGYDVVTSNSIPSGDIAFFQPSEVFLADEGGVNLDVSREASLVMDDGGSPAVTTTHSLWQENLIGLRVERVINWLRRRTAAVYYLTSCDYK